MPKLRSRMTLFTLRHGNASWAHILQSMVVMAFLVGLTAESFIRFRLLAASEANLLPGLARPLQRTSEARQSHTFIGS